MCRASRWFLKAGLCLALSVANVAATSTHLAAQQRPHILFAIADDWSWAHAGAYGDRVVQTPTFDALAREGVLLTHAFVSSPSCTPSRGAILTGQWHWRLQAGANLWCVFPDELATYPELLQQAGYEVGVTGKGWGPGRPQTRQRELAGKPFPSFQAFLAQRKSSKPFCFWLGGLDPHRPYELNSGMSSGINVDAITPSACLPNVPAVRSDMADYYFEVQRFDTLVGNAIEQLREAGELENTLVVMTSDNGMPFPRCKANLYDSGTRMPLAIRWGARVKGGRVIDDFVSFTDFAPTFLEAAGVDIPADMSGRSLMGILTSDREGQVDSARSFTLTGKERHCPAQEAPDMGGYPCRALRTREYLYVRNFTPDRWPAGTIHWQRAAFEGAWLGDCDNGPTKTYMVDHQDQDAEHRRLYDLAFAKRGAEELYDLRKDPDQLHNVIDDSAYAATRQQLSTQLTQLLKESGDPRATGDEVLFDDYPYLGGAPMSPEYEQK